MNNINYLDFLAEMGISSAHPGGFSLTRSILEREQIKPHHHVLDAGCGTGKTSEYLANHFQCHVSALDLHPIMLEKAKKRFDHEQLNIHLVQGNVENLPFDSGQFDWIIAESVTAFTNIPQTLHEYYRVLKPDGILIDLEMTGDTSLSEEDRRTIQTLYGISQVLTQDEWTQSFHDSGFNDLRIHKGETFLEESSQSLEKMELSGFHMETLKVELLEVWLDHIELMKKYNQVLDCRVYRAKK
ncbi:MAG: class I SAM-dependent methyltransferase [Bacillaceae bacterium]|nr:class I SAM-dependent methyltransferase [Bacillaceae bacterium]